MKWKEKTLIALTALSFNTSDGAHEMWTLLNRLRRQNFITIHDAVVVSWPDFKEKPITHRLHRMAGAGKPFSTPLEMGFDDEFVRQVRSEVTKGASALFILTCNTVMKQVMCSVIAQEIHGLNAPNFSPNFSAEMQSKFQDNLAVGGC